MYSEAYHNAPTESSGTLPVSSLRPNPANPRLHLTEDSAFAELVASIRAQGILQPLLVLPDGTLVAGHRRLAAAKIAGLDRVPVIVRSMSIAEVLTAMLTENLMRQDLSPLEEARAYASCVEHISQKELSRQCGVSSARISDRLCILQLDLAVQAMYGRDELPTALARTFSKIKDSAKQCRMALMAARRRLSVADVERIVREEETITAMAPAVKVERTRGGPTRAEAVALLGKHAALSISGSDLKRAMDANCESACADCGMANIESVCSACPLPQMIMWLVKRCGGRRR